MNITAIIAKEMGGEIEEFINNTPEIQFYASHDCYKWRDGRYMSTCDVDYNEIAKSREDLIDIFKDHLKGNS